MSIFRRNTSRLSRSSDTLLSFFALTECSSCRKVHATLRSKVCFSIKNPVTLRALEVERERRVHPPIARLSYPQEGGGSYGPQGQNDENVFLSRRTRSPSSPVSLLGFISAMYSSSDVASLWSKIRFRPQPSVGIFDSRIKQFEPVSPPKARTPDSLNEDMFTGTRWAL